MKIVCDVCGTTFPETETNCPICGCAKAADVQTVEENRETAKEATAAAAYAKGGRFTKSNVQRANKNASADRPRSERSSKNTSPEGNNIVLIGIVIALLLAIVLVVGYIGYSLLTTDFGGNGGNQQVTEPTEDPNKQIPCQGITVGVTTYEFTDASQQLLLNVEKTPSNTTDAVTFTSSDPDVATVTAGGLIAPGTKQGEAVITVTCGNFTAECVILSTVGEPDVTEPTTPPGPVLPTGFVLKLKTWNNSGEITIAGDEKAPLYTETMGIKASDIAWTSSDPTIATVENGVVKGVGKGTCTITATIGEQKATCKVTCTSDAAPLTDYEIVINKVVQDDVTINKDEKITIVLKHKETGEIVEGLVWTADKAGVTIDGDKIIGGAVSARTDVIVKTEYEGNTYEAIIRVNPS